MNFVDAIMNTGTTENGAITHNSSMSACLDLFSMGVSSESKADLIQLAIAEDSLTALKVVMYLRDVRKGQGNKDILRTLFNNVNIEVIEKLLPYVPEIGSWKDVYNLYGENDKLDSTIRTMVANALVEKNSLAAKWFPRQSKFHKDLAEWLEIDIGKLRREVVALSKTVEQHMCAKEWHEINYEHVPSIANKKYAKAFDTNDHSRYQDHLAKVMSGTKTVNSSVLYPHNITEMVNFNYYGRTQENPTANALWKSLPDYMTEAINILPIIDTSGSMWSQIQGKTKAIDIATGLGLYFAERNTGSFKNVWCNFSTNPKFYKLKGTTLVDKINSLDYDNWGGSTDLQKVFDLVLRGSKNAEEVPKVILIVSDMEFNCTRHQTTNFEEIKKKYQTAGLEMPTLVFWRVNVRISQQPVTQHETGSILINGYSPSIIKTITSMDIEELKNITPLNMMKKAIEPYNYIDELFTA